MTTEPFSRRNRFVGPAADITVRTEAPDDVRAAVLMVAEGDLRLSPETIRSVLCAVLRQLPDSGNWTAYPNVWNECQSLMSGAPWYKVYDFVEAMYARLAQSREPARAPQWETLINEYFSERGVGWRLVEGQLESRGAEAFEVAVDAARNALESAGLSTARQEIHEALQDLSRRPDPDLTGAVQHAMAALECTAREVAGDHRATLGEILQRYHNLVPRPLDQAIEKMWGYASEVARHIREGRTPSRYETELVVGVAAAACTYLAQLPTRRQAGC